MWRKAATEAGASVAPSPSGVPHFYKHFSIHPSLSKTRKKIFPSPGIEIKTSRCKKIKIENTSYKKV